jgi:hypothetical protein
MLLKGTLSTLFSRASNLERGGPGPNFVPAQCHNALSLCRMAGLVHAARYFSENLDLPRKEA